MPRAVSFSDAQQSLAELTDRVNEDRDVVIITRTGGKSVVMMPLDEYNSIIETDFLLRSPRNAERLRRGMAQVAEIQEGLRQAGAGQFASDEEVKQAFERWGMDIGK